MLLQLVDRYPSSLSLSLSHSSSVTFTNIMSRYTFRCRHLAHLIPIPAQYSKPAGKQACTQQCCWQCLCTLASHVSCWAPHRHEFVWVLPVVAAVLQRVDHWPHHNALRHLVGANVADPGRLPDRSKWQQQQRFLHHQMAATSEGNCNV